MRVEVDLILGEDLFLRRKKEKRRKGYNQWYAIRTSLLS